MELILMAEMLMRFVGRLAVSVLRWMRWGMALRLAADGASPDICNTKYTYRNHDTKYDMLEV